MKPTQASHRSLRLWALAGLLLGGLVALLVQAPAAWLAGWLAGASSGHVQLAEARGRLWDGSGVLVLTAGVGSRDASRLPGRLHWQLHWTGLQPELHLRSDCCSLAPLVLRLERHEGLWRVRLLGSAGLAGAPGAGGTPAPLLRLPAALLGGLGTPWNTLQLGGQLRLSGQEFQLVRQGTAWVPQGALVADLQHLSARISTVSPLGSYRLSLLAPVQGDAQVQLITLEGSLLLQGQGKLGAPAGQRFQGDAQAAPGREAALDNLLNIIGRRQGARSVITL